jgi:D-arabinose 1-dehydrogenase-like Zn-dependent alcohol dehydrogenase
VKIFEASRKYKEGERMLAARMHGYRQSLVLEEVNIPEISSDQVLVRVGGAGMCRSGVQLIDGYFQAAIKPKLDLCIR